MCRYELKHCTIETTLLLSLLLLLSNFTIGQVSFHEIKLGSKYSEQALTEAIEKANWCGYYHEFENYELRFDDGAIVRLKNKAQLSTSANEGLLEEHCFQNVYDKSDNIHFINSSGWIVIPKEKVGLKSKKN